MSFVDIVIVTVRGNDYRCNSWVMSTIEPVISMKFTDIREKGGKL